MIGEFAVDINGDFTPFHHLRQPDARLPEALHRGDRRSPNLDGAISQRGQVPVKTFPSCDESCPAVILNQADFPAGWRQPEVRIVDPEQ